MDLASGENGRILEPAPPGFAEYGDAGFWDSRYQSDLDVFEWYLDYSVYRHIITAEVPLEASVCISGCGNSDMPVDMLEDGYQDITAVDVSRVVIDQMKRKYKDEGIKWMQANMVRCEFPDQHFDAVLDKACLDAIWCHATGDAHLHYYLKQVERILKPGGVYICISSMPPDQQLRVLWNQDVRSPSFLSWEVDVQAIAKPQLQRHAIPDLQDWTQMYFIYICRRTPELVGRRQRWEEAQRSRAKRTTKKLLNPPTT